MLLFFPFHNSNTVLLSAQDNEFYYLPSKNMCYYF